MRCFVVMPIGDQVANDGTRVTQVELRERYDELIKQAILTAAPGIQVERADDCARPGSITAEIFDQLRHADIVVVDISFPNPNVFYEMGIRHASRPGTLIIRETSASAPPFDVAPLRYVSYDNTPRGLKDLSAKLASQFAAVVQMRSQPDNEFLRHAKLTRYQFQNYNKERDEAFAQAMGAMFAAPGVGEILLSAMRDGKEVDSAEMMRLVFSNPQAMQALMEYLLRSGHVSAP